MSEGVAVPMPTLAEVLARPETLDALAVDALLQLQQELGHLRVDVDAAVARHLARRARAVPAPAGAIMGTELTVVDVAARLHRPVSYVRELLRRKKLPGYRRGKYWVIPEADLLAWQALCRGLDDQGGTTLPSIGHPGRRPAHPRAARRYTVHVRRPRRTAPWDGQETEETDARDPNHG